MPPVRDGSIGRVMGPIVIKSNPTGISCATYHIAFAIVAVALVIIATVILTAACSVATTAFLVAAFATTSAWIGTYIAGYGIEVG